MNYNQIVDRHKAQCTERAAALAEWENISERLQRLARMEAIALREGAREDLLDKIEFCKRSLETRRDALEQIL